MILTVISGLAVGFALGFTLQRGSFCMNTAFRSIAYEKDHSVLRAYVLALLINMVVVQLLDYFAIITITRAPFFWPALIVGGFVFGLGMVFAGGCTSGTYYRCGEGMLGSLGALVGFAFAASLFSVGPLSRLTALLRAPIIDRYGEELTLYNLFSSAPVAQWIVTALLVAIGVIWLARAPKTRFQIGWSWQLTGSIIGGLAVAAWLFSAFSNRDFGLSFTQPTVSLARWLVAGDSGGLNWGTWMIIMVPFGAFTAARLSGDFSLRLPDPRRALEQIGGGLLMGAGAGIAGGCNIGHGITGISTLSLSSVVATLFTIGGVWAGTKLVYQRTRAQLQQQAVAGEA